MISGKIYRVRLDPDYLTPTYVEFYLLSAAAWHAIDRMKTGVSDSGLNLTQDRFRTLRIPIAPLQEQKRIVASVEELFSHLDATEATLQLTLTRLGALRSSVLIDAFHTNEESPNGWAMSTVGEVFRIVGGATPRTDDKSFWNGDIPWITPDDLSRHDGIFISRGRRSITRLGYDSTSTHMLTRESILFSSRAPIGYVAIAANPLCTNQGFKSLVPPGDVDPRFTYWYLRHMTPQIREMGSGTTFREMSKKRMATIPFPLVPLSDQRRIVSTLEERLSRVDSLESVASATLDRLKSVRYSILAAAFSGLLVPQDPDDEPASVILERIAATKPLTKRRTRT